MCGIAGFLRLDEVPAAAADARRMVDAMSHRGPDGRGAWAEGAIALGHARLIVRDRSDAAAQPMHTPGGEGVLVYNGEIYNDGALRADLARDGVAVASTGDAAVVAAALAHWGVERALRRFDGMFALAWWDRRARALWLARDRFGTKPLHVAVGGTHVAFASEVRGLRAFLPGPLRVNALEVARRIQAGMVEELRPPFEGIENLPPGAVWRRDAQGMAKSTYFDLLSEIDVDRLMAARSERMDVLERRVDATLATAVRAHLVSDVPVAIFASGGVDSNLVASYARESLPGVVGYTADTCDPGSEIVAATAMANHLGMELRPVRMDREAFLRAWPETAEWLEHPPAGASYAAVLLLARAARADGITVVLTGEGSDELFGGYRFFEKTRADWRRVGFPFERWLRGSRAARNLAEAPFHYQSIRRERDAHLRFASALMPVEESRAHVLMDRLARMRPRPDRAFLAHTFDALRRNLGTLLLRHDRLAMASSVEVRVPFLCNDVADLALHLPLRAKLHRGIAKWIVKRIAAKRLPPRLVYAKKMAFALPDGHHRGTSALLRGGAVADLFGWTSEATDDLVPRIEADASLRAQMTGLEIWLRIVARGERADVIADRLLAVPVRG